MKNNNKHIYLFIVFVAVLKLFFAAFLELGNDESYYYTYALQPQLNYFDHPPMVGILIRLSTFNLLLVNDVTLRLGAILSCAVASIYMYKIGKEIHSEKAGFVAVMLYNFSVYTGVIAGFFILPDSLQLPLWCASIYTILKLINHNKEKDIRVWLQLGLLVGIATLCKVHSLYIWAGFGLFILLKKSKWLLNYRLYLSFIITAICCLPILIWNIQNNFITYSFHSKRVSNTHINIDGFIQEFVGEGLYQNPIIFIGLLVAFVVLVKKIFFHKIRLTTNQTLLLCLSIPMVLLFWVLSMYNDIFPHWSGPAYIALQILLACFIANNTNKFFKNIPTIAGSLLTLVFVAAVYFANFYPNHFGNKEKDKLGEGCPTLDISGWKNMSKEFTEFYKNDIAKNNIKNPVILMNKWFPACQFELYTSTLSKLPIVALGNLEDVHQFAWLNKTRPKLELGNDAYCIVPSNQIFNVNDAYGKYFTLIELTKTIEQKRGGSVVRYFNIYRLKNCVKKPNEILTY